MKKSTLIPLILAILLFFGLKLTHDGGGARSPASLTSQAHQAATLESNAHLLAWYEKKSDSLIDWMAKRGTPDGPPDFIDFHLPKIRRIRGPVGEEVEIAKKTKELYDSYFPPSDPSSYVGTFFESGNPYIETTRGPYQWNSLKASEMEDELPFLDAVSTLKKAGISSMRIGPNLFELDPAKPETWNSFMDKIEVMWRQGVTPTISVAFFPSLKRWQVKSPDGKINYEKSYLLHPDFPKDMGRLASGMMAMLWKRALTVEKDLGRRVNVVINPINEPETFAGFNRQFWHGAYANWGDPETMKFYVPSIIQIAKANVEIRLAVEAQSNGRRILFAHNEAMTPVYYPSHHGGGRFAVSKFMLGDDVILKADMNELMKMDLSELEAKVMPDTDELRWALKEFVFGSWNKTIAAKEAARESLIKQLQELKDLHLDLVKKTSKTMKVDNMLLVDYYYQTEFILPYAVEKLVSELSKNNGEKLKEVLAVKTDEGFLEYLRKASTQNSGDLPPDGPKGTTFKFEARAVEEVDLKSLLTQNDYVILERLIGLRREFTFENRAPFSARQKRAGLSTQIYRLDQIIEKAAKNDGEELKRILAVDSAEDMWSLITAIRPVDRSKSLNVILNENGQEIFRGLMGIKRNFLLGFEPQHYARQIRGGIRFGFHKFMLEYVEALRIFTAGVGESGTPFYTFSPLLHDQVMMEYVSALKSGIYGTQYAFGPAVDTRGWAKAPLGLHYDDDHEINPSGLLRIVPPKNDEKAMVKFRGDEASNSEWAKQFLNPLFDGLR